MTPPDHAAAPTRRRLRALESLVVLLLVDLLLRSAGFPRVARWFGLVGTAAGTSHEGTSRETCSAAVVDRSVKVGTSVASAARRLPQHPDCLPQAVATHLMLRRRGICAAVHLGMRSVLEDEAGYAAHAWVSVGERVVVGRAGHRHFSVVRSLTTQGAR